MVSLARTDAPTRSSVNTTADSRYNMAIYVFIVPALNRRGHGPKPLSISYTQ
ncbi:MAG: hypothetical protein BWY59_01927 [Verrucomicrobia bacterium ADurb.Bin345]|nr:MAG: hypothetical protein BWY59_01927 [Verrucomicrobia bacterium ADurb.Bin345]